jgi:DNA (cytosine-5)-methyltransferase 1
VQILVTIEIMNIDFIDLFSGIGGMRLGFEQAAKDCGAVPRCVYSCEKDKKAADTYDRNFKDAEGSYGDITEVRDVAADIPPHDFLMGGFPCQAFSKAGHQKGFDDIRGTLFFDVARFLSEQRPKAFLLENVYDLTRHDKGRTFATILDVIRNRLGFKALFYEVLNSKHFGVPQNRPRIFIVGFDEGYGGGFRFPIKEEQPPEDRLVKFGDIRERTVSSKYFLSEKMMDCLKRHKENHAAKGHGFGYSLVGDQDIAKAILCGGMGRERNLVHDPTQLDFSEKPTASKDAIRQMTPVEWERLQSFPDNFTAGQADGPRYKQLGNSVTVNVIQAICSRIVPEIMNPVPYFGEWVGEDLFE